MLEAQKSLSLCSHREKPPRKPAVLNESRYFLNSIHSENFYFVGKSVTIGVLTTRIPMTSDVFETRNLEPGHR